MNLKRPPTNTMIFGFDSAWTDAARAPGALCAIAFDDGGGITFHEPRLVSFAAALATITELRQDYAFSLVAIDQPTIVPNASGSRPVDKVAGALVSFVGGGVQPANRSKTGMFCDQAPIWPFLAAVGATQDPIAARTAATGHYIMEVFPALALPSLAESFSKRLGAPKYNPQNRRKFRLDDWRSVARVTQSTAAEFGVEGLSDWAEQFHDHARPRKADQDMMDAALCALIGLVWRAGPESGAAMLGDTTTGYMVTPISGATRPRLEQAAIKNGVPVTWLPSAFDEP